MPKKNSIFMRLLIPVVLIMLVQSLLIASTLFVNGTVRSLEDGSINTLKKNTENRRITLENMMVYNWSDLGLLESSVQSAMGTYIYDNQLNVDEFLSSTDHVKQMLPKLSDSVLQTLRYTSTTGAFLYFLDDRGLVNETVEYQGLYYRDLDPLTTPAGYEDVLYLRGPVNIARVDNIGMDGMWSEKFTLSPTNPNLWKSHYMPISAALETPGLATQDYSYWSDAHIMSLENAIDANSCITYTRPILYGGRVVGVMGLEIQVDQLRKYFPASDFGTSGQSGYILIQYEASDAEKARASGDGQAALPCNVIHSTGSYINRMISAHPTIDLVLSDASGIYSIAGDSEDVSIVMDTMRLYNTNAPHSNEQWALAAIGTNNILFESSNRVRTGIYFSSALAFVLGMLMLTMTIRIIANPLNQIVQQIVNRNPNEPIDIGSTKTYEIDLLAQTLNSMKAKQRGMEMDLRAERERYLIALESATSTFIEYDAIEDCFMIYFFVEHQGKPELLSTTIDSFMQKIKSGGICHASDIDALLQFLSNADQEVFEVRLHARLFKSSFNTVMRDGTCWFTLKVTHLLGEHGELVRVIGVANEITEQKLSQLAKEESERRDTTTGAYKRDFGISFIASTAEQMDAMQKRYVLCMWRIVPLDRLEAHYGRIYCGLLVRRVFSLISELIPDDKVTARLANDEFLMITSVMDKDRIDSLALAWTDALKHLYVGENTDLALRVCAGYAISDGSSHERVMQRANAALKRAIETAQSCVVYDESWEDEPFALESLKPVSIDIDVRKENAVALMFDLYERSSDLRSVISLSLITLGEVFGLNQVIISSFDPDFGANHVYAQWSDGQLSPCNEKVERIPRGDFAAFDRMLDENGTLIYSGGDLPAMEESTKKLLCINPGETSSGICCVLYVNGVHTGRIVYKSTDMDRAWSQEDYTSLYEISKIVAAHIGIERSSSANRAKSDFLSRMSHEIRTPMNAIIGMTAIARDAMNDPERLSDALGKIDFSSQHLLALINDVLDMSRIESGKMQLEQLPFSMDTFIDSLNTLMRPPIEGKGIRLDVVRDYQHGSVIGDEYRLRQVLVNLLGNANKFTNPGGTITLTVREMQSSDTPDASHYLFSVRDTGIGINKADQQLVFKAFEQSQSSKQQGGTGLGLAISTNIIAAMNSHIELDSEAGVGSDFYFTLQLPHAKESIEPGETAHNPGLTYRFDSKRVLLAEDNEINREIALFLLENVGFEAEVAVNGQIAVDMFRQSAPGYYDAILMDIQMPVMDGLTATREIRKDTSRPDASTIPIVAMTANAFDEDMRKSIESGMNGHVAKPINAEQFYALLADLIGYDSIVES